MTSTGASSVDGETASDAVRISFVTLPEQQATVEATQQKNIMAALKAADFTISTWEDCQVVLDALVPSTEQVTIKNSKTGNKNVWVLSEPENAQAVSPTEYNVGSYGGELYQKCGTVSQTVDVPSEGLYRLTLTALYREGTADCCYALGEQGYELSNAYVSINNTYFARIPSWYSDCVSVTRPNTVAVVRTLMNTGKYVMEVYAYVGKSKKATITIHVPGYVADGWCVFNNFVMTPMIYNPAGIDSPQADTVPCVSSDAATYNLAGQRVVRPTKGIYITSGKKVHF